MQSLELRASVGQEMILEPLADDLGIAVHEPGPDQINMPATRDPQETALSHNHPHQSPADLKMKDVFHPNGILIAKAL